MAVTKKQSKPKSVAKQQTPDPVEAAAEETAEPVKKTCVITRCEPGIAVLTYGNTGIRVQGPGEKDVADKIVKALNGN